MTGQLELLEGREEWELDDQARRVGRRGVEQARAALREARRHLTTGGDESRADDRAA